MPEGVLGYFAPYAHDLNFFYDRQRTSLTVDVMFHEGNHMLTHMIDEHVWYPAWINEGMAEYYGASEWDPVQKKMTVGGIQSGRLAALWATVEESEKWQGLEDLIKMGYAIPCRSLGEFDETLRAALQCRTR